MSTFNYFDLTKIYFKDLAELDAEAARAAIAARFADVGVSIPLEELSAAQLAAGPAHSLVVWANDDDMAVNVFAVPEGALSEELSAALVRTNGMGYAFDEIMSGGAEGTALLRLDAALGHCNYEDMLADYEDVDPDIAGKIPEADRECMEQHRVATLNHKSEPIFVDGAFSKRFTAAFHTRRSQ